MSKIEGWVYFSISLYLYYSIYSILVVAYFMQCRYFYTGGYLSILVVAYFMWSGALDS